MAAETETVIMGWPGLMVHCGLGDPIKRGVCASLLTGAICYAAKMPGKSFDKQGNIRPVSDLSMSPHAVTASNHFLLTPLAVGTAIALLT